MNPAIDQCSPNSKLTKDFNVTIIDSRLLAFRLSSELARAAHEFNDVVRELRRDPIATVHRLSSRAVSAIRGWMNQPDLMLGHASGVLVLLSAILLIVAVGRIKPNQPQGETAHEDLAAEVVMLELPATIGPSGAGYDARALGRVGLRHNKGEGSAPPPARARGGGSGGMGHKTPAQIGKVPQSSSIPAPILNPPINASLPVAGVDLDPLLWRDIKYPAYGVPNSIWLTPSNGPGKGGGMGPNKGTGIGDGRGPGYGSGTDGNTGGGPRQIGSEGDRGGPGGGAGGRVFHTNEVDQKVRLLSKPEPHYSEEARRNQISGTVVLRVIFSSTGEVTQIRAINSLPFGLTERAITAARQIKFVPAMKNGHPVSVHVQLEYNFNLY